MASVALLGTLDTNGPEYAFLGDRVRPAGCDAALVDGGVMSGPSPGDITADEVAAAVGVDRGAVAATGDRGSSEVAVTEHAPFQEDRAPGGLDQLMLDRAR